jgi:hypothetical protein
VAAIVAVTGIPAIEQVLDALDPKDRQNLERRAVRAGAKPIAVALRGIAAASRVPRSFSAATPAKMVKVTTHGGTSGRAVEAIIRPPSPLFNILQPGAKAHTIAPRTSGLFLSRKGSNQRSQKLRIVQRDHPGVLAGPAGHSGWDETGRKRGAAFFSSGPVRHPGLASRDILGPAFTRGAPAATDAIAAVIFNTAPGGTRE